MSIEYLQNYYHHDNFNQIDEFVVLILQIYRTVYEVLNLQFLISQNASLFVGNKCSHFKAIEDKPKDAVV